MSHKIYVASSWRNTMQPAIVSKLRRCGDEVYGFRNPVTGNHGFHWEEIDPDWQQWTVENYVEALYNHRATEGFMLDMTALNWCDTVLAVQPFGVSTALELGWACGVDKHTILLLSHAVQPELMVKMVDHICTTFQEVLEILNK